MVSFDVHTNFRINRFRIMKLFIADDKEIGFVSDTDYHWCDNGDILMFGQFQTEDNRKGNEVSMCGINSRKFTTHIVVKELAIERSFLYELVKESVEKAMECKVDENDKYSIYVSNAPHGFLFDVNLLLDELIEKANKFNDGDKVRCVGRKLTKI